MTIEIEQLHGLAIGAATRAGELLLAGQGSAHQIGAKSSPTDVVTQMDRDAEAAIVTHLRRARPDDAILGEEGGTRDGTSGVRWVIDPLDGTVNYLYGLPLWGVSVAAEAHGQIVAGVVAVPALGQLYHAQAGGPALLSGASGEIELSVRATDDVAQALVATGFGYRRERRAAQATALAEILPGIRDVRRCGAAALDLCWLAAGHYDGYFERGLQPWDLAAGTLIARQAGAVVTGAEHAEPDGEFLVAAGPALHEPLRRLLVTAGAHRGG